MEFMEILEGNKLIAEFMGKPFKAYLSNKSFDKEFKTFKECQDFITENDAKGYSPQLGWNLGLGKYHSSWDWLMPVVEKIEHEHNFKVSIFLHCCDMYDRDIKVYENLVEITAKTTKIEAVWLAVTEFIKWYNTQSLTNTPKK